MCVWPLACVPQVERALQSVAQTGEGDLRHDFERLLAAAVAAREEVAEQRCRDAEGEVKAAEERLR